MYVDRVQARLFPFKKLLRSLETSLFWNVSIVGNGSVDLFADLKDIVNRQYTSFFYDEIVVGNDKETAPCVDRIKLVMDLKLILRLILRLILSLSTCQNDRAFSDTIISTGKLSLPKCR